MSVVNLKVYEGVPVGGNNFEDILNYIRGFLGANFGFSTNTLGNQGGYFQGDNFVYKTKPATGGQTAYFFAPDSKPLGNLFGQYGNEYYKFDVPTFTAVVPGGGTPTPVDRPQYEPGVNVWTLLATDTRSSSLTNLVFENIDAGNRQLPYRPITSTDLNEYRTGYLSMRLNGIPQTYLSDYSLSFGSNGSFMTQTLQVNRLTLGAEYPKPTHENKYSYFDSYTRNTLSSEFSNNLTFEFTNFSIESGGHILLWRQDGGNNYFAYVPQDLGSSGEVPIGTFRVTDYSRGTIEIRPSIAQVEQLRLSNEVGSADDIPFLVISPEQLRSDVFSGVTNYMSRYGEVYNGSTMDMLLVEYIFDGNNHLVREIPSTEYYGASGSILIQDVNQNYADGVVLAIKYLGIPNQNELLEAQRNRYQLDSFQLYFHSGIVTSGNIFAVVELNPSSWYNRDVYDAEYYPVNRVDEAFYSLITENEALNAGFDITFDPNLAFEIVDTISLMDLSDIGNVSANQVLVYNGSTFNGVDYALSQLIDTSVGGATNNHVLQRSGNLWVNRTVTAMLTSTSITDLVRYSSAHSIGAGDNFALVHKKYVDDLVSGISGGSGTSLADHINNTTNAHGASQAATASAIARRTSTGTLIAASPPNNLSEGGLMPANMVATTNWISQPLNSNSANVSNTLIRRGADGIAYVTTPDVNSLPNAIATKQYVDSAVGDSNDIIYGYISALGDNPSTAQSNLNFFSILPLPPGWYAGIYSQTPAGNTPAPVTYGIYIYTGHTVTNTSPAMSVDFKNSVIPAGHRRYWAATPAGGSGATITVSLVYLRETMGSIPGQPTQYLHRLAYRVVTYNNSGAVTTSVPYFLTSMG